MSRWRGIKPLQHTCINKPSRLLGHLSLLPNTCGREKRMPSVQDSLPPTPKSPWLVAIAVMLATFMEVLDTSIAAVALPYIAGSLSATNDEATWV